MPPRDRDGRLCRRVAVRVRRRRRRAPASLRLLPGVWRGRRRGRPVFFLALALALLAGQPQRQANEADHAEHPAVLLVPGQGFPRAFAILLGRALRAVRRHGRRLLGEAERLLRRGFGDRHLQRLGGVLERGAVDIHLGEQLRTRQRLVIELQFGRGALQDLHCQAGQQHSAAILHQRDHVDTDDRHGLDVGELEVQRNAAVFGKGGERPESIFHGGGFTKGESKSRACHARQDKAGQRSPSDCCNPLVMGFARY